MVFFLHLQYGTDEAATKGDAGKEAGDEESQTAAAAGEEADDRG